jgi:hypothetical protein
MTMFHYHRIGANFLVVNMFALLETTLCVYRIGTVFWPCRTNIDILI